MSDQTPQEGELILYRTADDAVRVEVRYESETFWLDQRRMAELFGVDARTVSEHLRNIYASGELSEEATLRKLRLVRTEGTREVARDIVFYNLDAIIFTTLQKFPFVSRQLLKMAEARGEAGSGTLQTRRCAVVIDEAHSSQGGETATDLKEVLGGEALRKEAQRRAAEEGHEELEELFRSMAKRGQQANLSFFAFTATPKHKTLAVFGRNGKPAHRYTMRQAIEEGFILDVLKSYTTYATYFRLLKSCEDDPNVERKKAARALARFLKLHPHNLAQKTEVMVEHFHAVTRHKIGGRAKAMVVTGSRLEAVRYKQSFDKYIKDKGYPIRSLVAFSGTVQDDKLPDVSYTEEAMNGGLREKELPERFASPEYQVLLVAEKYQTGFDQPLLHTMYVDKRLAGIQAVQTLSRLNRIHPLKEDTFVLDFVNDRDEIREAFKAYYEGAEIGDEVDPARLYAIKGELDAAGIYLDEEVARLIYIYLERALRYRPQPGRPALLRPDRRGGNGRRQPAQGCRGQLGRQVRAAVQERPREALRRSHGPERGHLRSVHEPRAVPEGRDGLDGRGGVPPPSSQRGLGDESAPFEAAAGRRRCERQVREVRSAPAAEGSGRCVRRPAARRRR